MAQTICHAETGTRSRLRKIVSEVLETSKFWSREVSRSIPFFPIGKADRNVAACISINIQAWEHSRSAYIAYMHIYVYIIYRTHHIRARDAYIYIFIYIHRPRKSLYVYNVYLRLHDQYHTSSNGYSQVIRSAWWNAMWSCRWQLGYDEVLIAFTVNVKDNERNKGERLASTRFDQCLDYQPMRVGGVTCVHVAADGTGDCDVDGDCKVRKFGSLGGSDSSEVRKFEVYIYIYNTYVR